MPYWTLQGRSILEIRNQWPQKAGQNPMMKMLMAEKQLFKLEDMNLELV